MCGFAGIYNLTGASIDSEKLRAMTALLKHRGPDDEGFLLLNTKSNEAVNCHGDDSISEIKKNTKPLSNDFPANLGIGFRRLSIIDLSANGHQPMRDEATGNWITFNGEIYNYLELRDELKKDGYSFHSNTDTEVILKAYSKWGVDCVQRFNGMWAFAIWDSNQRTLFCSRDRFGVKPLYYYFKPGDSFVFASEIKSVLEMVPAEANYSALGDFFSLGISDHTQNTFFKNIHQLRGAYSLLLTNDGDLKIFRYYDLPQGVESRNETQSIEKFREIFFDAVKLRLRSDVAVGYALSGGIDSSSVVLAASELSDGNNNSTFSTVYPGESEDESFYIDKVLEKTNFKKNLVTPKPEGFLNDLDDFVWHHEEPISGLSYYAEYVLRRFTRQNGVIVSLEGQGADEIITGYASLLNPYLQDLLRKFDFSGYLKTVRLFRNNFGISQAVLYSNIVSAVHPGFMDSMKKMAARYSTFPFIDFEFLCRNNGSVYSAEKKFNSRLNQSLYEFLTYTSIPTQLIRADKNAMAFSVECRFPFLDYRLVEFAFGLNADLKIHKGVTKYILREAMKNHLPAEVYGRKDKKGFPVPVNKWLEGKLKKFMMNAAESPEFRQMPFLNWKRFMKCYEGYKNGSEGANLWSLVSVFLWHQKFKVGWK